MNASSHKHTPMNTENCTGSHIFIWENQGTLENSYLVFVFVTTLTKFILICHFWCVTFVDYNNILNYIILHEYKGTG